MVFKLQLRLKSREFLRRLTVIRTLQCSTDDYLVSHNKPTMHRNTFTVRYNTCKVQSKKYLIFITVNTTCLLYRNKN